MGHACVVGAGGAVCAPPGDAPAGGAPANAGWTGGAACSGGKGWAANMPNALTGEKQEGHKKRNSEYRGWDGRG